MNGQCKEIFFVLLRIGVSIGVELGMATMAMANTLNFTFMGEFPCFLWITVTNAGKYFVKTGSTFTCRLVIKIRYAYFW